MNKLDSAILFTNKAIDYLNTSDLHITNPPYYNFEKGNSLNTLGLIYTQTEDYELTKKYLFEAAALCQDENSRDALVNIYISMADMYRKNQELDFSLLYAQKALSTAQLVGTLTAINNAYSTLTKTYKSQNNIPAAFKYLELSKELNDNLSSNRLEKVNQYQSLSFNEQIRLLANEKDTLQRVNKYKVYGMLAGIGVIGLITFILYRNNRQRANTNKQLETLNLDLAKRNGQNELLLKEIHHRVKNNLEIVSSLLGLQSAKIDNPEIQDAMLASQNRVLSMGILHQKLYQSEHLAFIEMKNYFKNLSENILDSYNAFDHITIDIPMKEIELDVDTAVPIGLIVNELLTNSLKYAFPKGQSGKISVSLNDKEADMYELRIADNGVGKIDGVKPQGTGFGTQLVSLLTRQLDGKLEQKVDNGTEISIYFKKGKAA